VVNPFQWASILADVLTGTSVAACDSGPPTMAAHQQVAPNTKMVIGPWHIDE